MTTPCVLGTPDVVQEYRITKYLWIDYIDLIEHPNLRELLFPSDKPMGIVSEVGHARYAVPETHPNISFIVATVAGGEMIWTDLAESNQTLGETRIFI